MVVPLGPPPVRDPDLLGAPSEAAEAAEAEAATPLPRCCYPGLRCEAGQRQYKILITQGERKVSKQKLSWMYRNVRETLLEGLRSREEECGYKTFVHVPDNDTENGKYPVQMRRGDVLIHIGLEGRGDFVQLCRRTFARRKVYCIEMFLEPAPKPSLGQGVCEIWTYSHGNLWSFPAASQLWNRAAGALVEPPLVRFVPPGFVVKEESVAKSYEASELHWGFIGAVGGMQRRRLECLEHLQKLFPKLESYHAWNLQQWRSLTANPNLAFFNIHQDCNNQSRPEEQKPLETVRISGLLSAGFFVVTEEINQLDAEAYDGIVYVEKNMWLPLESWSVELRRLLSNSEGLTRYVQKAQRTFQRKFAARRILEDAQAPRRAHGGSRARSGDWREG
ncbi:ANK_REP_REGION domain-containing protein [Durusdinium trenchii]|uniref:ANK_REP_REGION domain-containing protein n=1 Tax=Durusdinium trenchii TaxID=1381693 RepID=A0ABP0J078_9DINO